MSNLPPQRTLLGDDHGMPGNIEIAGCVTVTPAGVRVADMAVRDHGRWRRDWKAVACTGPDIRDESLAASSLSSSGGWS